MAPNDVIYMFSVFTGSYVAHHFVAPHPLHISACGISYTNKELPKIACNSASYPFNSWSIDV